MTTARTRGLLVALLAVTGLVATGPAPAAATPSADEALTGPPVPAHLAALIPSKACVPGGATSADGAVADKVRADMNGSRLGGAVDAYNVSCARIITETSRNRGLTKRAAVIAVTTAITESTLHNYTEAVDHDSLGLFQQRPSQGWGDPDEITDPVYSTNAFLSAMLRKYPGDAWKSGDIGAICQAVQVSAVPDAYAREVHDAGLLVDALWTPPDPTPANRRTDYNGDGKADLAFFRPSTGTWWIHDVSDNPVQGTGIQYGAAGDVPVPGDYDGDGRSDLAFFRPSTGTWWIHDTNDDPVLGTNVQYGAAGDIPVPGDYDGDGKFDLALFRPSTGTWWIHNTSNQPIRGTGVQYGAPGDIPAPGDYNGDGKADLGFFRPSTGTWWIHDVNDNPVQGTGTQYGANGDIPVPGDYDGDKKFDLAFFRPSTGTWWIHDTNDDPILGTNVQYGAAGDIPVPGDYNGDGKSDLAFFRPSTGTWWIHNTSDQPIQGTGVQYGASGDLPVARLISG